MKNFTQAKPALFGAVAGALLVTFIGFSWGGWTSESSATRAAEERAQAALVRALAPICADSFRRQADADSNLAQLREVDAWKRGTFLVEGGWATMPGAEAPESGVARACADILSEQS